MGCAFSGSRPVASFAAARVGLSPAIVIDERMIGVFVQMAMVSFSEGA